MTWIAKPQPHFCTLPDAEDPEIAGRAQTNDWYCDICHKTWEFALPQNRPSNRTGAYWKQIA